MTSNKRFFRILIAIVILLLIPWVAMQFSSGVNWSPADFLVMGTLLLITGIAAEIVMRKVPKRENRIAIIAIILIVFLLVWAEIAVGVFGSPFAGS